MIKVMRALRGDSTVVGWSGTEWLGQTGAVGSFWGLNVYFSRQVVAMRRHCSWLERAMWYGLLVEVG